MQIRSSLTLTALLTLTACGGPPAAAPVTAPAASPATTVTAAPAPKPTPPPGWDKGWAETATEKVVADGKRSMVDLKASARPADEARKHGFVSFVVDARDAEGAALTGPLTSLALSVDGKALPGQWLARPIGDTEEEISVIVVVQATRSYTTASEDVAAPIEAVKAGSIAFLRSLPQRTKASVMVFDDEGARRLGPEVSAADAAKALEAWSPPPQPKEVPMAPPLYATLAKAVSMASESTAAHRYLLLVTDGHDRAADNPRALTRLVDEVGTAADAGNIGLLLLGCTLDMPEPLVTVNEVASKSGGIYRKIGDGTSCPAAEIERAADAIKGRRMVGFRPTRGLGPDLRGAVRIDAEIDGAWAGSTLDGVTLPLGAPPAPTATK